MSETVAVCAAPLFSHAFAFSSSDFCVFPAEFREFRLEVGGAVGDNRRLAMQPATATTPSPSWLGPWLPAWLAVVCMAPTLGGDFTRDDVAIVQENPRVRSLADWRGIWLEDWWSSFRFPGETAPNPVRDRLYRPLTLFSIALQGAVHGVSPLPLRVGNVLLHAVATVCVWLVTRRLLWRASVAFLAALLFAVHPVHVEAVAEIVGRAEILAATFLMAGVLALAPASGPPTTRHLWLAAGAFLAAVLSKETGVCYPLIALFVLIHRYGTPDESAAELLMRFGGRAMLLLGPLVVYLGLRVIALDGALFSGTAMLNPLNPLAGESIVNRVIGAFTVLGEYTRLALVPWRLSSDYGLGVINPGAGVTGMTVVGALAAVGLGWLLRAWSQALATGRGAAGRASVVAELGFLSALFVASYLLISNTILVIGVSMAERLFYWPSVPVLMGVAVAIDHLAGWSREPAAGGAGGARGSIDPRLRIRFVAMAALVALATTLLAARSTWRGRDWRDNVTLFAADAGRNPESVMLNLWYAQRLTFLASQLEVGAPRDEALARASACLERAAAAAPDYPLVVQQQGLVAVLRGDVARAIERFERALRLNPNLALSEAHLRKLRSEAP